MDLCCGTLNFVTHRSLRSLALLPLALLLAAFGLVGPSSVVAQAAEDVKTYEVDSKLSPDGSLSVNATVTFAKAPGTLEQRFLTRRPAGDRQEFVYTITELRATAEGKDLGAKVEEKDDAVTITVDPAKAGGTPIVISYKVRGAVRDNPTVEGRPASTTFQWHFLQGLNVGVEEVSGKVNTAAQVSSVDCQAGPAVHPGDCLMWQAGTEESHVPTFSDGPRHAGEIVALEFTTSADQVKADAQLRHQWSLDRAFSLNWPTAGATLAVLALGAGLLWALHRRVGRDEVATSHPTMIAEFSPVAEGQSEFELVTDIRPGQIGTVADERVDPVDVTGTLLDLAVRGWMRIEQLPTPEHSPMDWSFTRLEGGRGSLRPYEQLLLDAVAPVDGTPVTVSHIHEAVGPVVPEVQDALYDDVVEQGWFAKRPDAARNRFQLAGAVFLVVALVILGLLIAFSTFALVGLALVTVALAMLFVSQEMPRRSSSGAELLAGLHGFASLLQHQRTDQMPPGKELSEISEILPYAVVLGGKDRWIQAIVRADKDATADSTALDWYHAPEDWHLQHLPASLDAFVATVQGRLFGR